ncbi:uncharacterized protein DNG_00545 [Cephalotrichum gorgonifer]|uniref:Fanconi-associated nuclease n=1 Tax=Cephalotrichum gorgonifer TaxID=2041049 RepID=A0AAE8SQU9_9PEZI|nr:uncharacterized protein DNG_00545 [Cephalotrichum gorgonifer]
MDRFVRRIPPLPSRVQTDADGPAEYSSRPSKKARLSEDSESDKNSLKEVPSDIDSYAPGSPLEGPLGPFGDGDSGGALDTAFDSVLSEAKSDEAIKEYEATSGSQNDKDTTEITPPKGAWAKGKSSIYVDAFNLALDTVLEDEAHLFDERERHVFDLWKTLSYECQYLYVRLFLRKTASWHRISRLGYYSDISDMDMAVSTLQEIRTLREPVASSQPERIPGPCIRISESTFKLFQRVHLVFHRSTEWTEKSLTTIILAKISRRNFANYPVCRTSNIFSSRSHILEFEAVIKLDAEVDAALESGDPPGEKGFRKVIGIFESIYPRWLKLVAEEQVKEDTVYEYGEGAYLRRFTPAHTYTRVIHKAAYCFGRLKDYRREYDLLKELLAQRLFHPARRGSWYQRKALLEEHYMFSVDSDPASTPEEQRKKRWRANAVATCEMGLQDVDCHLIYHHDLQKRLVKLERRLRIPRRLQHDFAHVRLQEPMQHTAEGIQIKRDDAGLGKGKVLSTKTTWVDEREGGGECSVEEMCLSWYRSQGWKGYHSEGGILRTLFAYLFFDIIFAYVPNVFQTAYQTCPLDLHTDTFYLTRISEINRQLAEISNGEAERILREVYDREHERKTCVVGLNWDFDIEDLAELVHCFPDAALAAVCKVMAQEYRQRGGGIPDLILWRTEPAGGSGAGECMFSEVKSANDRLSDTQRLWIHVLMSAGVKVALCNAVAREVRVTVTAE